MTWYFTFPPASPDHRRYVRIEAENFWLAREQMVLAAGTQWSEQYSAEEFAEFSADRDMHEIAIADIHPYRAGAARHATYLAFCFAASTIWVVDLDGFLSVTNDAEYVVEELHRRFGDRRFLYRDTQGKWDELVHQGPRFLGYAHAPTLAECLT